jgi:DNA-binding NarL/FixJ family response regulator
MVPGQPDVGEVAPPLQHNFPLTPRQLEVLGRLREGKPNKLIARDLNMTEATVKVHVRQIMRKLGATNRTQAVLCASGLSISGSGERDRS